MSAKSENVTIDWTIEHRRYETEMHGLVRALCWRLYKKAKRPNLLRNSLNVIIHEYLSASPKEVPGEGLPDAHRRRVGDSRSRASRGLSRSNVSLAACSRSTGRLSVGSDAGSRSAMVVPRAVASRSSRSNLQAAPPLSSRRM
jgi:hypothetical protein